MSSAPSRPLSSALCSLSPVLCPMSSVLCPLVTSRTLSFVLLLLLVLCPLSSCYFLYSVLCPLVTSRTLSFVLLLLLVLCPLLLLVPCPLSSVTSRTLSFVLLLLLILCPLSSCYFSYSVLYPLVTSHTLSSVFLPVYLDLSLAWGRRWKCRPPG